MSLNKGNTVVINTDDEYMGKNSYSNYQDQDVTNNTI
jgi:hypothetical protein